MHLPRDGHLRQQRPGRSLPADYTFKATDAGVHVFHGVTLNTPGLRNIHVNDLADPTKLGNLSLTVTS